MTAGGEGPRGLVDTPYIKYGKRVDRAHMAYEWNRVTRSFKADDGSQYRGRTREHGPRQVKRQSPEWREGSCQKCRMWHHQENRCTERG